MTKRTIATAPGESSIHIEMTNEELEVRQIEENNFLSKKAAKQYAEDRRLEYPSLEEQLDKIYHEGIDAWKLQIKAVKDKYPKPS